MLENDITRCREQSSRCHSGYELSIHISCHLDRLVHIFFSEGRGSGPKVYVVAIWTKPNTRSRGKAGESIKAFSVFLLPIFFDAVLSLASRRVLRIGFRSVVFLFSVVEVLIESTSLSLIGIERDGESTRLPRYVKSFR